LRSQQSAVLAANFIVVGQGPQLDAIFLGAGREGFWRQGAIRDHRVAM
jgi:hypothetical protein